MFFMKKVLPAILAETPEEFNQKLSVFSTFATEIQIDITDGKFVTTKTNVNILDLKYFTSRANIEFHLMIDRPEALIGEWIKIGPKRVIVHIEAVIEMENLINVCRENSVEVGLALNPETPLTLIVPWINAVDMIMFLGVHPGRGGQEFIPDVLDKIKSLRQNFLNVKIGIDGGVKLDNIEELKNSGIDIFVIGSGILKSSDISNTIKELKFAISYKL